MAKVSVIMPVYNVERYFRQCIESVIEQKFSDIEIIAIDDGSPDNCGIIINEYAKLDKRIKPIHQSNGGYGKAVNAGLKLANGDYIIIVETDDWIENDMIEVLYSNAVESQCDVVKGAFMKHETGKPPSLCSLHQITNGLFKSLVCPATCLSLMLYESSIWSAIYKKDFLRKYEIWMLETAGAAYQDVVFKFMVYSLLDKILLINKPVYNYRVFAEGSSSTETEKADVMFSNYNEIEKFLRKNNKYEDVIEAFYVHQFFDFNFHLRRLSGEARQHFVKKARQVISDAEQNECNIYKLSCTDDCKYYLNSEIIPVYESIKSTYLTFKIRHRVIMMKKKVNEILKKILRRYIRTPFHMVFLRPLEWAIREGFLQLQHDLSKLHELQGNFPNHPTSLCVSISTAPSKQFEYYLRANELSIIKKIEKLKVGLDFDSKFQVDRYFKIFKILPTSSNKNENYIFPILMGIFSDEERFVLSNYPKIMEQIQNSYSNLDMNQIPLSLNAHYYECGIRLLPNRISEQFKGTIALDCGAWVGDTAIPISRYGFKKVICFEPIPETFKTLKDNIKINKLENWISCFNLAVDEIEREGTMTVVGDDGSGSLLTNNGKISIQTTTIDSFVDEHIKSDPVTLIKMDIEGKELPALKGAIKTIKKFKPVLLIAAYHTWIAPEQMFEIKSYIETLNLGYKFKFKCMQPEKDMIYEYSFICWSENQQFPK